MEFTGKIIQISPVVSGTSQSGNQWRKQEFVLEELADRYPQTICLTAFNDKCDALAKRAVGETVRAIFDCKAREQNGRWFNSLNLWAITDLTQQQTATTASTQQQASQYGAMQQPGAQTTAQDDLPF